MYKFFAKPIPTILFFVLICFGLIIHSSVQWGLVPDKVGDGFNGILSPFISLATAFIVYYTLKEQKEVNYKIHKDLEEKNIISKYDRVTDLFNVVNQSITKIEFNSDGERFVGKDAIIARLGNFRKDTVNDYNFYFKSYTSYDIDRFLFQMLTSYKFALLKIKEIPNSLEKDILIEQFKLIYISCLSEVFIYIEINPLIDARKSWLNDLTVKAKALITDLMNKGKSRTKDDDDLLDAAKSFLLDPEETYDKTIKWHTEYFYNSPNVIVNEIRVLILELGYNPMQEDYSRASKTSQ